MSVKKDCLKFSVIRRKIIALKLTGNPSTDDSNRCAGLKFTENKSMAFHYYDVLSSLHSFIRK